MRRLGRARHWQQLEFVQADEGACLGASPEDLRRRHIVCDAKYPGLQRAAAINDLQASPQGEVSPLQEIATLVVVHLEGATQALDRPTKL